MPAPQKSRVPAIRKQLQLPAMGFYAAAFGEGTAVGDLLSYRQIYLLPRSFALSCCNQRYQWTASQLPATATAAANEPIPFSLHPCRRSSSLPLYRTAPGRVLVCDGLIPWQRLLD